TPTNAPPTTRPRPCATVVLPCTSMDELYESRKMFVPELRTASSGADRQDVDASTFQRGAFIFTRTHGRATSVCCTRPRSLTFVVPSNCAVPVSTVSARAPPKYLSKRT